MVGTGKAAEYGILVKSAQSLENLHTIDTVALDKTGTITSGRPAVTDIEPLAGDLTPDELLRSAAAVETGSEHPLAEAVVERAKAKSLSIPPAEDFTAEAGRGVRATIEGAPWLAGNEAYLTESGVDAAPASAALERFAREGKTPLLFAREGKAVGVIAVADTVRPDSARAIRALDELGIRTVMLTGDNPVTAEAIRAQVGISRAVSGVLPADKEACVRSLQREGHRVAMPPRAGYADRVFTTEVVSFPGCAHIGEDKDFSPVIEKALALGGYAQDTDFTGINGGRTVTTGFGHDAVLGVADKVIDAVKSGVLKHIFLVGGCDGARPGRNYYTEFVMQTPPDSLVLTLACGKYRFNDLDLGTVGGLPRLMDMSPSVTRRP